ncbi:hypothetical protein ACFL1Q_01285 [Patescibacteria group bacterium]
MHKEDESITICRPDDDHYCVECCYMRGCANFGKLSDGTRGCLGHPKQDTISPDDFPILPSCAKYSCLFDGSISNTVNIKHIKEYISMLPSGEFKMDSVFAQLGYK